MFVAALNTTLSILTVIGQVIVVLIALVFFIRRLPYRNAILNFIRSFALIAAFLTALIAMVGSLFYSEIAGYTPCVLCWYQRIALYPQVLLLGLAAFRRDRHIADYCLGLSVIGGLIAGFNYREQISPAPLASCSTVGFSVSCSERFVTSFGYITIPLMAATAFAMIILFLLTLKIPPARNAAPIAAAKAG